METFEGELTGHNHYSWCTCGWCVGGGNRGNVSLQKKVKPTPPAYSELEKREAKQALTRFGASSYTRCFVNPNASCPVCGETVYFYANSNGSRVYFDELGKPWTKHPCTDNGRSVPNTKVARPSIRPIGEIKEIIDAEKKLDSRIFPVGRSARKKQWKLAVVTEVEFSESLMRVLIEDISDQGRHQHRFHVYCDQQLLDVGDFVSRRGRFFSFLDPDTLESLELADGEILLNLDVLEGDIDQNEIPQDISVMLPSEKRHFTFGHRSEVEVQDELRSLLVSFAKRGIVGPNLVSHYLNATERTTAFGAQWTPRLAFFLISLSGVSQEKPAQKKSRGVGSSEKRGPDKKQPKAKGRHKSRPQSSKRSFKKAASKHFHGSEGKASSAPTRLSNDVDDWAQMLSRLGRVSRKENDE